MKNINHKTIGILGGMGPDASARLYQMMVEKARSKYGAEKNNEYPNIILHSLPVPDFISDKKRAPEALEMLKESAAFLAQRCEVMGIACNTVHLYLPELQAVSAGAFISMIDQVAKTIANAGYKKVALLATPTTIRSGFYQKALNDLGVETVLPSEDQIEELGQIAGQIVSGEFVQSQQRLLKIANSIGEGEVEAIVLGCTELPLVFPTEYSLPTINSLNVLADSLLDRYYFTEI